MSTSKKNTKTHSKILSIFWSKSSCEGAKKTMEASPLLQNATKETDTSTDSQTSSELTAKLNECAWGLTYEQSKKTLLLDLDNTLIYASKEAPEILDYSLITFKDGGEYTVRYVIKRPGVTKFLKKLSKRFNICVFTSAEETYAKKIIEVTKIHKYIYALYHRAHCEKTRCGLYLKNIWSLGFEQKQALLIDDLAMQAKHQPENCFLIKPFEGEASDRELYTLYPFLRMISSKDEIKLTQGHFDEFTNCDRKQNTKEHDEFNECDVDLDEGCRGTGIRTFECHSTMMRSNNHLLI